MSKRLEILERSLERKNDAFSKKIEDHFSDVRRANGQPLNDKRNGRATLNRWDRQNESLRSHQSSIDTTVQAIEREKTKIAAVTYANEKVPAEILELVSNGTLNQWRKHPFTFFVAGVDKARLVWDEKRKVVAHKYTGAITDRDQWKLFAGVFNQLAKKLNP